MEKKSIPNISIESLTIKILRIVQNKEEENKCIPYCKFFSSESVE